MSQFTVFIDFAPFDTLDKLALLACQNYNLGNTGDWFGECRGGIKGFFGRAHGVERQYAEAHAWLPYPRADAEHEYHLATIFFHMDSALECLAFAFNAFGWIVNPSGFRDITSTKEQKKIRISDIVGDSKLPPLAGYRSLFPTVQTAWQDEIRLITQIQEQHDVSKHRKHIGWRGKMRSDPPAGFFERLGLQAGDPKRYSFTPYEEISLKNQPKLPRGHTRPPRVAREFKFLEDLAPAFVQLIAKTGAAAIQDVQANVPFKKRDFLSCSAVAVR